jgi:hypothetical protein
VAGGVGDHRLEPLAGRALLLALLLGFTARGPQPLHQIVAGALELGDSDQAPRLGGGDYRCLRGGHLRVRREAPLEARDLIAKSATGRGLVAAFQRRRLGGYELGGVGIASRIEDPRQIAGIDAGVAGGVGSRGGKLFDGGGGRARGDKGPLALAGGDKPLHLQAPVDGARRIGVDAHPGSQLPYAG